MKIAFVFPALIIAIFLQVSNGACAQSASPVINQSVLLELVNTTRKKGCNCGNTYYSPAPVVKWNDQLETAASDHSNDMFLKKYFSHVETNGSNAGERLQKAGYHWSIYGENIAEGYLSEEEVIRGWLSSPGHCSNMMNKSFTEMGVGRKGNYWTMDLGAR